jgi:hypothetical protein
MGGFLGLEGMKNACRKMMHTGTMGRGFTVYIFSTLFSNTLTPFLLPQHKIEVIHLKKKPSQFSRRNTVPEHILLFNFIIKVIHVLIFCGITLLNTDSSYLPTAKNIFNVNH